LKLEELRKLLKVASSLLSEEKKLISGLLRREA